MSRSTKDRKSGHHRNELSYGGASGRRGRRFGKKLRSRTLRQLRRLEIEQQLAAEREEDVDYWAEQDTIMAALEVEDMEDYRQGLLEDAFYEPYDWFGYDDFEDDDMDFLPGVQLHDPERYDHARVY